jgi:hypothetical protein
MCWDARRSIMDYGVSEMCRCDCRLADSYCIQYHPTFDDSVGIFPVECVRIFISFMGIPGDAGQ